MTFVHFVTQSDQSPLTLLCQRGEQTRPLYERGPRGARGDFDQALCQSRVVRFRLWILDFSWWWAAVLVVADWTFLPASALAQMGGSGMSMIELYGMVQVEPGANVLTLGVKDEEIRFAVQDVRCSDQRFSTDKFLSDTKHRTPGVHVRGPEPLLDLLIKERPSKRALKLSGIYYVDTRVFVLNGLAPFNEKPKTSGF